MKESAEQSKIDDISLIGFRIHSDSETPEFYTLFTYGEVDAALRVDKDLAFFTVLEQKQQAFELFSEEIKQNFSVPDEVDLVADVTATLNLFENKTSDDSAVILNCLNTIFDLLQSADIQLSDERKNLLWKFADHLTFEKGFGQYLTSNSIGRESITDALSWCIGVIVTRSIVLFT
jgi:hypothetical protein